MATPKKTFDIFVEGLPADITKKTLNDLFAPFGGIYRVLIKDNKNNDGNKIGFIKYFSKSDAEKAINERAGHMWDGNGPLVVKWALNRANAVESLQSSQSVLPAEQLSDDGSATSPSSSTKKKIIGSQNFQKEILRVTFVEDSVTFWAKSEEDEKSYLEIHRILFDECGKALPIKEQPIKNKIYATQYSEDGAWYRCRVLHQLDEGKCLVRYVDFGNAENVRISNIVDVPKNMKGSQKFADKYRINKLEANDPLKLEKGRQFLNSKLIGKNLEVKILAKLEEDFNLVEILNEDLKTLPDELLSLKYATQKMQGNIPANSSFVGSPPLIQGLLQERDAAKAEATILKSQLSSAQEQIHQLSTMLSKNDFKAKVAEAVEKVAEVKTYRAQFLIEDHNKDPLLRAEKLLLDNTRVLPQNLLLLPTAKRNLEKYEECQKEIYGCSEEDLAKLLTDRDEARRHLHESLETFILEVNQLPLQERLNSLESVLEKIMALFQKFLDIQTSGSHPLEILMEHYKEFKERSYLEVAHARNETDSYQGNCKTVFHQLLNALTIEDPSSIKTCPDLIFCLEQYNLILDRELEVYKKEEAKEKSFVAMVVQKVIQELNQEKNYIISLQSTLEKYISLEKELRPWLTQKPDISPLYSIRKEIKIIKSKLRHQLANQEDLEEMEDDDQMVAMNIEIVSQEINAIRQELHKKYKEEDQLLASFSQHVKKNFPELAIEFPEIEMEIKFNGVLRKRSLDEYDTEILPTERAGTLIFKTEFNGRVVILKEFILNTSNSCSKDQFLQRINEYVSIKSDHLVPVETVFFTKNERQVYIQMPFYEQTLFQFLTNKKVDNEMRYQIIQDIMNGLAALHSGGIVHGSVRPENIRINNNGRALFAAYNFTKSLAQRKASKLPAINNLTFMAPELLSQTNAEPTMASDVFAIGCVVLWIRQNKLSFIIDDNGIPDLSLQFRPEEECEFFSAVFNKDPQKRPTSQELLSFQLMNQL